MSAPGFSWQKKTATESWSYRELAVAAERGPEAMGFTHWNSSAGGARVLSFVGLSGHGCFTRRRAALRPEGFHSSSTALHEGHRRIIDLSAGAIFRAIHGAGEI